MLAADVEELVINYLKAQGLVNVSVEMPPTPPLPFYKVTRLDGGDDMVTDYPCVSIHCFDSTRTLASDAGRTLHKLMKQLTPQVPILMNDGSYASIDHIDVVEAPAWQAYEDKTIWRYCGRYHIDQRVNQTT